MAMRIVLKHSSAENALPSATQLPSTGEIALNYNGNNAFLTCLDSSGDIHQIGGIKVGPGAPTTPAIAAMWLDTAGSDNILKVWDGSVWQEVSGSGGDFNSGPTPPGSGNSIGDVFFDTTNNQLLYWDGSAWQPIGGGDVTSVFGRTGAVVAAEGDYDLDLLGDVSTAGAVDGSLLQYTAATGSWGPGSPGAVVVNLDYTNAPNQGTITNDSGTNAVIPLANGTNAGLTIENYTTAEKDKLALIDAGAEANPDAGRALTYDTSTTPDTLNADIASTAQLGVVQIGSGLSVTGTGEISVDATGTDIGVDLTYTANGLNAGTVNNTGGDDATIPIATTTTAGLFAEKAKLDGIEPGAEVNVDVDLGYTAAADKGTVTNTAGDDAVLPLADGTNAGLTIENFTTALKDKLDNLDDIGVSPTPPSSPNLGDLWIDTSQCPPVLNIWDDCSNPGNPTWTPIGDGTPSIPAITFDVRITDSGSSGNVVGQTLTAVADNIAGGVAPEVKGYKWFVDNVEDVTATTNTRVIVSSDVGAEITCMITCGEPGDTAADVTKTATYGKTPAEPEIDFNAIITDSGPNGNKVGETLTAVAQSISGGVAPVEYAYQWYSDGAAAALPAGAQKEIEILNYDIGRTITCEITVAEPDGSNAVTKTATYGKTPEAAGVINKPTVLTPPDGAGIGAITYTPKTSAIDAGGVNEIENGIDATPYLGTTVSESGPVNVPPTGDDIFSPEPAQWSGFFTTIMSGSSSSGSASVRFLAPIINPPDEDLTVDYALSIQELPASFKVIVQGTLSSIERTYTSIISTPETITVDNSVGDITRIIIRGDTIKANTLVTFAVRKISIGSTPIGKTYEKYTELTLTDSNTYNNADDSDMSTPISTTFVAGDTVNNGAGATGTLTADADDAGPTIVLTDVTGTWSVGDEVINDKQVTEFGPSADDLEFTSSVPSGTDITTYAFATWEVDTDSLFGSPMTTPKAITAGAIQELLPAERGAITLAADTEYHVRVKYDSADPAGVTSVYSDANHFQTSSAVRTANPSFLAYDADNNKSVNDLDIVDRFGVDPTADNTRLGIYELTEQPTSTVAGYVPEGDKYKPIIDLSEPLEQAQAEAAQANARLDEANATIEEIRADFEARIAALENP